MKNFVIAATLTGLLLSGCGQQEAKQADVDIRPKATPDFSYEGVRADIDAGIGMTAHLKAGLKSQATAHSGSPLEHRSCRATHKLGGWDVFCTSVGMYGAYFKNSISYVSGGMEVRTSLNRRQKLSTSDAAEFILGS